MFCQGLGMHLLRFIFGVLIWSVPTACFGENKTDREEGVREVGDVAELWNTVAEVNRVWLAPSPERLSYSVTTTHPKIEPRLGLLQSRTV